MTDFETGLAVGFLAAWIAAIVIGQVIAWSLDL